MAFDPTHFSRSLITDTCSVWNVLSSLKLYRAARAAGVTFAVTPTVLYECLGKRRKVLDDAALELIQRLKDARQQGAFVEQACDLDDLLLVSRQAPAALSSGELSCIVIALRGSSFSFMTDERRARGYASETLRLTVETTPKLYGWLHFHRHLVDGDHSEVVTEHERFERRPLTRFFAEAYEVALQYRLMAMQQ